MGFRGGGAGGSLVRERLQPRYDVKITRFRAWDLRYRVQGRGLRVEGLGYRVSGLGIGIRI